MFTPWIMIETRNYHPLVRRKRKWNIIYSSKMLFYMRSVFQQWLLSQVIKHKLLCYSASRQLTHRLEDDPSALIFLCFYLFVLITLQ